MIEEHYIPALEDIRVGYWCRVKTNLKEDPWSMSARGIVYDGLCPSINEFRFICKLLNIK